MLWNPSANFVFPMEAHGLLGHCYSYWLMHFPCFTRVFALLAETSCLNYRLSFPQGRAFIWHQAQWGLIHDRVSPPLACPSSHIGTWRRSFVHLVPLVQCLPSNPALISSCLCGFWAEWIPTWNSNFLFIAEHPCNTVERSFQTNFHPFLCGECHHNAGWGMMPWWWRGTLHQGL